MMKFFFDLLLLELLNLPWKDFFIALTFEENDLFCGWFGEVAHNGAKKGLSLLLVFFKFFPYLILIGGS